MIAHFLFLVRTPTNLGVGKHASVRQQRHEPTRGEQIRLHAARLEMLVQLRQVPHQQSVKLEKPVHYVDGVYFFGAVVVLVVRVFRTGPYAPGHRKQRSIHIVQELAAQNNYPELTTTNKLQATISKASQTSQQRMPSSLMLILTKEDTMQANSFPRSVPPGSLALSAYSSHAESDHSVNKLTGRNSQAFSLCPAYAFILNAPEPQQGHPGTVQLAQSEPLEHPHEHPKRFLFVLVHLQQGSTYKIHALFRFWPGCGRDPDESCKCVSCVERAGGLANEKNKTQSDCYKVQRTNTGTCSRNEEKFTTNASLTAIFSSPI